MSSLDEKQAGSSTARGKFCAIMRIAAIAAASVSVVPAGLRYACKIWHHFDHSRNYLWELINENTLEPDQSYTSNLG